MHACAQFAATACTIVSGAIAERARFEAYIMYSFFMASWVRGPSLHGRCCASCSCSVECGAVAGCSGSAHSYLAVACQRTLLCLYLLHACLAAGLCGTAETKSQKGVQYYIWKLLRKGAEEVLIW